jgi:hypothetical protein
LTMAKIATKKATKENDRNTNWIPIISER